VRAEDEHYGDEEGGMRGGGGGGGLLGAFWRWAINRTRKRTPTRFSEYNAEVDAPEEGSEAEPA